MKTSKEWIEHFEKNKMHLRINWELAPAITEKEMIIIRESVQAWQLGETSEGLHLLKTSGKYASKICDPYYTDAVRLFIKEEQKHGNNLGRYLDVTGQQRIRHNWGDTLFRKIRYFNNNMEIWTLTVITVESAAQVYYQSLKDATCCPLLKQICTDILIDEAYHIDFQTERLSSIYLQKSRAGLWIRNRCYKVFFFCTLFVVWMAHKKIFKAGGNNYTRYMKKMTHKYNKIISKMKGQQRAFIFVPTFSDKSFKE